MDEAMTDPQPMETLSQAMERLRRDGYRASWRAEDGALVCGEDDQRHDPSTMTVDEVVRFEGASDPGDESALFALTAPSGTRGLYEIAYGPDTPTDDLAVVRALPDRPR